MTAAGDARVEFPSPAWSPRPYQLDLWRWLERAPANARASIVWPRRSGKDEVGLHWLACSMISRAATYWHTFPKRVDARDAVWLMTDKHTGKRRLDEIFQVDAWPQGVEPKFNGSDMSVEFANNATYRLFGFDNASGIGSGVAGMLISEWALVEHPEVWGYLEPMLLEGGGWAIFVTTPRGRNHAFDTHYLFEERMLAGDPRYFAQLLTVDDTRHVSEAALDQMLQQSIATYGEQLGRRMWRQEWWCVWDTVAVETFIGSDIVEAAVARYGVQRWEDVDSQERVLGVDVARSGRDRTVLVERQGGRLCKITSAQDTDTMQVVGMIGEASDRFKPHAICIDMGYNPGVADVCRRLKLPVVEVQFGGGPVDPSGRYRNRRAEIWAKMKRWLETVGAIPKDHELALSLTTPRIRKDDPLTLESKEDIRTRGLRSPDYADALALTFATPVSPRALMSAPDDDEMRRRLRGQSGPSGGYHTAARRRYFGA